MVKKVLIITYYWPPSGGPGVQRALKFAKYLPEFGWEPIILSVNDGEYPAIDKSLEKDIPKNCKVFKSKAFEPNLLYKKFTGMKKNDKIPIANLAQKNVGWRKKLSNWIRLNLFIPDAKIGWIPYAVSLGKKIIQEEKPDIIFSTSPPPSVHLIAKRLAKWSGIKWVADFRDPWTKIHYLQDQYVNPISKNFNKGLEKSVVSECDKAICVSHSFIDLITTTNKDKFEVITNGYDVELDNLPDVKQNDKFTLLYIGGLTWNRYFKSFFHVLNDLLSNGELDKNTITLRFAGSIEPTIQQELVEQFSDVTEFKGYLSHSEAIKQMYQVDLLLLFLEQVSGYEGHIPGKLFEYISTGGPILGIGNTKGESAQILRQTGVGNMAEPDNFEKIKELLLESYNNWKHNKSPKMDKSTIQIYSRKELTKKLVREFETLIELF